MHDQRVRLNREARLRDEKHTCIHAHIHTPIHTYIHTYIHKYIHTHTHTHIHGTGVAHASIHPCKHSATLKKIIDQMESGDGPEMRPGT